MGNKTNYNWHYCSVGGVVRVNISSGEDIAHLGELDQKLWTVLSCPVDGLQFNRATLEMLDTDKDGKIHVNEVVAAAQWVTSVLKDKDILLKSQDTLPLESIDRDNPNGAKLYDSALQILSNLGKPSREISLADSSDSVAIFANTKFNGDGVITPASADDASLKEIIEAVIACAGSSADRSGVTGVTSENIEAFYTALADYSAWQAEAAADKESIFPYGDDTEAALQACEALKSKVADYFMRCKLIGFNSDASAAVDVSVDRIGAISAMNLAEKVDEIAGYPIARPRADAILPFAGINPAWQASFAAVKALVFDKKFPDSEGITEQQWLDVLAGFSAYSAWKAAKKGSAVESLGIEKVNALLAADSKAALLSLVEQDKALEPQATSINEVNKLMHYVRYFYSFLCNYVIFTDFYSKNTGARAMFEAGRLFIDRRCCELCIRVSDMGKHADMAKLSGMFLIYCTCTSKVKAATMDIVAVMTAGSVRNLRPGTNGVFYDLDGQDWDAVVTKVVDNPINLRQAFWSPYRKLGNFINEKITKFAEEKESKSTALLQEKAGSLDAAKDTAKQPFDIAKYTGIFAAISLGVGALGMALAGMFDFLVKLSIWQFLALIIGLMLVISGPSCFIAWRKLRKRNLGPVLNANGWAINSSVLVNIIFGSLLTSEAKYPKLNLKDPFVVKVPWWKKAIRWILLLAVAAFIFLFATDNLHFMGIDSVKVKKEVKAFFKEKTPETSASETPAPDTKAVE